ncbi:fimbrial protein [Erwinia sp. 198]|uniref:fimbrial protein n=1 Tax=Erwinia sp. 198 TaxID=2022746 RepID=UPI0013154CBE|nr:fimbrial protein [Erwinia sp. 198]
MLIKSRIYLSMTGAVSLAAVYFTVISSASAGNIEVKATIKAVCSLSVASPVDLGDIPIMAFDGKNTGEEITGYDKNFSVTPMCAGTDKYTLSFTAVKGSSGCLAAESEEIGFCLYDGTGEKIMLSATGASLERNIGTAENIKVVPARAGKAPTAGDHSGTMTVTIAPL